MRVGKASNDGLVICLSQDPLVGGHRPSVNVMLDSLSSTQYKDVVSVIMTGMGSDGSEGIKKVKALNGAYIIAQDEKSCVVYGMPRTAVQTGLVDAVVPLKDIAGEILKIVGVHK
jgi:two-component system chemotaxis response regulator CheB